MEDPNQGLAVESATALRTFVARQPIFNKRIDVYAYELLFRSDPFRNFADIVDCDAASSKVIANASFLMDLRSLTGGRRAFINVTRDVLLRDHIRILPTDLVVVEILETVEATADVVDTCRELKQEGYALALDDYVEGGRTAPLLELADIVKVDFLACSGSDRRAIADRLRGGPITLLAEKVETHEMLDEARELGFTMFQGFFFAQPVIVAVGDVAASQLNLLRILRELHRPELDYDNIESVVRQDLALSYKLLRYINAAFHGLRTRIHSLRRALVLLGERELRRWASLVVMTMIGEKRPKELIHQALVRARFCELLAEPFDLEERSDDLFLLGLFSLMDVILGRPMTETARQLPVCDDLQSALNGLPSRVRPVLEFVAGYERGDWDRLTGEGPRAAESFVSQRYLEAVDWARRCWTE